MKGGSGGDVCRVIKKKGGIIAEPSVLGGINAIADYLVAVVESGVEDGYRRANPMLFSTAATLSTAFDAPSSPSSLSTTTGTAIRRKKPPSGACRSDSLLPEYYEDIDGGRDRRHRRSVWRGHSLERRNTVADVESTAANAASAARSSSSFSAAGIKANNSLEDHARPPSRVTSPPESLGASQLPSTPDPSNAIHTTINCLWRVIVEYEKVRTSVLFIVIYCFISLCERDNGISKSR